MVARRSSLVIAYLRIIFMFMNATDPQTPSVARLATKSLKKLYDSERKKALRRAKLEASGFLETYRVFVRTHALILTVAVAVVGVSLISWDLIQVSSSSLEHSFALVRILVIFIAMLLLFELIQRLSPSSWIDPDDRWTIVAATVAKEFNGDLKLAVRTVNREKSVLDSKWTAFRILAAFLAAASSEGLSGDVTLPGTGLDIEGSVFFISALCFSGSLYLYGLIVAGAPLNWLNEIQSRLIVAKPGVR